MFTLTRRESSPIPLDVTGILPETVANLSALEVAKLPVLFGNRREELGQHFEVDPASGVPDLQFIGKLSNVHGIGVGMRDGTIGCTNPVGRHAGARMTGGHIVLIGAGDWLGAEMHGGQITCCGPAGDCVGAAYRGSRRGMTGGKIWVVRGSVGHELGLLMRRGTIIVHGDTGEFAGASMIAGTIAVCGKLGGRAGAGMKRGTILALGGVAEVSAGMRYSCEYLPSVLSLLGKTLNLPVPERVHCYRGDVLTGGRGELLVVGGEPGG